MKTLIIIISVPRFEYETRIVLWRIDPLLRGDSVKISHCYGAPAAYAREALSHIDEVMQAVFSEDPL
jgi:hypothetical protein